MVAGDLPAPHESDFLFYTGPDGKVHIEVIYANENVWMTQKRMAELFNIDRTGIGRHINKIFDVGELSEDVVSAKFAHTTQHGAIESKTQTGSTTYYNLDVIISVGYKVDSIEATTFRKWATTVLREYMIKGFALDDQRLKNGTHFGKDYFDELLERIREIRLSERRIYLKVTDIFALASDYDRSNEIVKEFFAFIQNKLHYAVAGGTAAELIHSRADKTKDSMGLETWKQAPNGKILRTDVTVAKNYLNKSELEQLQFVVSAFLDIAEARARRGIATDMAKWVDVMNGYLDLNEYPRLQNAGKVSKKQADKKALTEYEDYRIRQDREYIGDFEREVKKLEGKDE